MAFETDEGTPILAYGELVDLARNLDGEAPAAGLGRILHGASLSASQARAALGAARVSAATPRAHQLIDRGLARLEAA